MSFQANPSDLESVLQALSHSSNAFQQESFQQGPQTYQNQFQSLHPQQQLDYSGHVTQHQRPALPPEEFQQYYNEAYQHLPNFDTGFHHPQSGNEQYDPNQPLILHHYLDPAGQAYRERPENTQRTPLSVQRRSASHTPTPVQHAAPPKPTNPRPSVDPSTILDWKTGLRHMTEIAARNEHLGQEIKKMIKTQHSHEQEWAAGREALIKQQKERAETKNETDDLLRKIGKETFGEDFSPTNATADLDMFDRKVHRALQAMTKDLSAQLAALGVPFFGTRPSLYNSETNISVSTGGESGRMSATELRELQRRMLRHLEDLFGE